MYTYLHIRIHARIHAGLAQRYTYNTCIQEFYNPLDFRASWLYSDENCMYICMYVCMYVWLHVHMYTYTHAHVTYIYMDTYTYTCGATIHTCIEYMQTGVPCAHNTARNTTAKKPHPQMMTLQNLSQWRSSGIRHLPSRHETPPARHTTPAPQTWRRIHQARQEM